MLTSTLKNNLIPSATTMQGSSDVRAWIESVVTTTWQDARCGDGRCEAPFEYPEYGRFGCKADCNLLQETSYITPIQVDIYYNFSHPKGSVSPIDLMQDAKWNLCPLEVDELIGPRKIFHGSDCYYEEDQGFEEQVGHIVREIDDVPDGDWTIVVKKDIFPKVAGAAAEAQRDQRGEEQAPAARDALRADAKGDGGSDVRGDQDAPRGEQLDPRARRAGPRGGDQNKTIYKANASEAYSTARTCSTRTSPRWRTSTSSTAR